MSNKIWTIINLKICTESNMVVHWMFLKSASGLLRLSLWGQIYKPILTRNVCRTSMSPIVQNWKGLHTNSIEQIISFHVHYWLTHLNRKLIDQTLLSMYHCTNFYVFLIPVWPLTLVLCSLGCTEFQVRCLSSKMFQDIERLIHSYVQFDSWPFT
jgi:hypothetical protein